MVLHLLFMFLQPKEMMTVTNFHTAVIPTTDLALIAVIWDLMEDLMGGDMDNCVSNK